MPLRNRSRQNQPSRSTHDRWGERRERLDIHGSPAGRTHAAADAAARSGYGRSHGPRPPGTVLLPNRTRPRRTHLASPWVCSSSRGLYCGDSSGSARVPSQSPRAAGPGPPPRWRRDKLDRVAGLPPRSLPITPAGASPGTRASPIRRSRPLVYLDSIATTGNPCAHNGRRRRSASSSIPKISSTFTTPGMK